MQKLLVILFLIPDIEYLLNPYNPINKTNNEECKYLSINDFTKVFIQNFELKKEYEIITFSVILIYPDSFVIIINV